MALGGSGSTVYKEILNKICKDDKNKEDCDGDYSMEQCISHGKDKCNLDASCNGISHERSKNEVRYCYSSDIENGYKFYWNTYMKSESGKL